MGLLVMPRMGDDKGPESHLGWTLKLLHHLVMEAGAADFCFHVGSFV